MHTIKSPYCPWANSELQEIYSRVTFQQSVPVGAQLLGDAYYRTRSGVAGESSRKSCAPTVKRSALRTGHSYYGSSWCIPQSWWHGSCGGNCRIPQSCGTVFVGAHLMRDSNW